MTPIAVTIAGSDSGGGAGIQADLKTFSALGVYGASVIAALTAQNTQGVAAIHDVPPDVVTAQIEAVYADLDVAATKIGMLSRPAAIEAVADGLLAHRARTIILDPVMVAASGDPLITDAAIGVLRERLIPYARLITPNLMEAARLLDTAPARTEAEMVEQAKALEGLGAGAVLLKGGHAEGEEAVDVLVEDGICRPYRSKRHSTDNTHGTGCTLSSAIAAEMAKGLPLDAAVQVGKNYVNRAIAAADDLTIGQGRGPVHHFHAIWPEANQ